MAGIGSYSKKPKRERGYKMKGLGLFGAKRKAIKTERKKFKAGETTKEEFKAAKKEIKTYTDY